MKSVFKMALAATTMLVTAHAAFAHDHEGYARDRMDSRSPHYSRTDHRDVNARGMRYDNRMENADVNARSTRYENRDRDVRMQHRADARYMNGYDNRTLASNGRGTYMGYAVQRSGNPEDFRDQFRAVQQH